MKFTKAALIICLALGISSMAMAQQPYEFHASDYRTIDTWRAPSITVNADENNFVVNGNAGQNNIAFGLRTDADVSGKYYITPDEYWYVVKGTGLSIQAATHSYVWWMNGFNNGAQVVPDRMLEKDGVQLLAWNIKKNAGLNGKFSTTENMILTASGGFIDAVGLTSAQADNKATITLVDYMTEQEINNLFGDITSSYITNPSFEDGTNGWTLDINTAWSGVNVGGGSGDPQATDGTHIFGVWDGASFGKHAKISQNVTLPAGTYKLTVDMHASDRQNAVRLGDQHLFCGETKAYFRDQITTNGVGDTYPMQTITMIFTVDANDTQLEIGANMTEAPAETWYKVDNFHLYVMDEEVKLSDTEGLSYPVATYDEVTLTRTIKQGWNTICLPFATTAEAVAGEGAEAYAFSGAEDNELTFTKVEKMVANTPYLINVPETQAIPAISNVYIAAANPATVQQGAWSFKGNYTPGMNMEGKYGVSGSQVRLAGSGSTLNGMRAYLEGPDGAQARIKIIDGEDEETSIDRLTTDESARQQVIYDLSGRRVSNAQKGIYIINGKKVLK